MTNSNLLRWGIIPNGFLKKKLNRIILLKYEICLNQVYICDAFFYIIRMQTLFFKKNAVVGKWKRPFCHNVINTCIITCLIKHFTVKQTNKSKL